MRYVSINDFFGRFERNCITKDALESDELGEVFYSFFRGRMKLFRNSLQGEDLEDLIQNTVAKALAYLRGGGRAELPENFFGRMLLNSFHDLKRKQKADAPRKDALKDIARWRNDSPKASASEERHASILDRENWIAFLEEFRKKLDENHRLTLELMLQQIPCKETAERLGIAEGTVWSRVNFIKKKIREDYPRFLSRNENALV